MESELIAIGVVLLVVAAVLLVAVGAAPTPLDVHLAGKGRIYVLEYTRPTDFKSQVGWLPGRILLVEAKSMGGR